MNKGRDQWSSRFGFIMAAAGSAIGLGNIWKFPYMTGTNGGAVFLITYILFLILLGIPILLSEMSIGRFAGMNAVDSCKKISDKFAFVGMLGVIGSFIILSYYSVVGGWIMKYIAKSIFTAEISPDYFGVYTSQTAEPIVWTLVFLVLSTVIIIGGVSHGIEKVSSILLPILFILFIIIMIYSLTLPNAIEGVKFFIIPDFSQFDSISDIGHLALNAMGQVFFSLSLGMGTLITYGSYLSKDNNMPKSAVTIVILDTVFALIAGFAILPAVFSFGLKPNAGAGLVFQTLPAVFSRISFGSVIAVLFFVLVFFAAITSSISLLEVIVTYLSERYKIKRITAASSSFLVIFILSCFASSSFGLLSNFTLLGLNIFDILSFISDKIIMPAGGIATCILVGYIWDKISLKNEVTNEGSLKFRFFNAFRICIKYISPVLIVLIFIGTFF